ncbi:hypothetical protein AWL63_12615 [Sphingomonas panacis]|uniref:DUF4136 domain-containing protein n=1 Tax=Sphingomonas panacis TaxID=1560345 RepID=A0A1B3ZB78_9SPHN|nr:DUF4136 domain-containing protein [Sphingomonas panacis]AOH84684.1 hypothetical protein AWL63_12615 [Sphingomonas panacis]
MKMFPFAAAALLALGGCAQPFAAKVSRFQQLAPSTGQTFVIQPADPNLRGGLEFSQYASLVSGKLAQQGYRPAQGAPADLVVKVAYDVDHGRERTVTTPGFGGGYGGYGGWGGGYGGWGGPRWGYYGRSRFAFGFNDPFMWGGGFGPDVSSYTVYTSELMVTIERSDTGAHVFEGTAKAQSRTDDLPYLVPRLVEAMFTGFPGNSGETVKITIAPEKKG